MTFPQTGWQNTSQGVATGTVGVEIDVLYRLIATSQLLSPNAGYCMISRFTTWLFLLCVTQVGILFAQPVLQDRNTYLKHIDAYETSQGVEAALATLLEKQPSFLMASSKQQIAAFFSFVLTLNGYTGDILLELREEGLDVAHAITANNRPLVEQALMADLVVKGTVSGEAFVDGEPGALFREITVRIDDVFKGAIDAEEITIRQRNGREYGENPAEAARLEQGRSYLLLLSNGLFRYAVFSDTDDLPESQSADYSNYYSIYRHYEMDGQRILWSGYNKRKSKRALDEVRWLDTFTQ